MLAKTLKRAGLGFFVGVTVGNVITALAAQPNLLSPALVARMGGETAAFLLTTLFTGMLGAVSFAGISFYDIESWSLLRTAVVHYAVIEACYIPMGFFLGWFERWGEALIWMGICAVSYLIVFLILCAVYRAQVRELNELNEKRKKSLAQQARSSLPSV